MNAPEMEPAAFKQAFHQEELPVVLDVREAEERAGGYIPGSIHIPMNWVPYQLAQLDKARQIVVYCAHGVRSNNIAAFLIQQGYQAISLRGGIYGWLAVGGEITYGRK
jgi:thioredoxin 1